MLFSLMKLPYEESEETLVVSWLSVVAMAHMRGVVSVSISFNAGCSILDMTGGGLVLMAGWGVIVDDEVQEKRRIDGFVLLGCFDHEL
jgi:hypothetical protein